MLEVYKLFPTSVFRKENVFSKNELKLIYEYLIHLNTDRHEALDGDSSSSHFLENYPTLDCLTELQSNVVPNIKEVLSYHFDYYAKTMGIMKLKLGNSWFNIQNEGSLLRDHIHDGSVASMALYVNAPSGSSPIVFQNPNLTSEFNNTIEQYNEHNWTRYQFDINAGDLIIFPSWLKHGSGYHKNDSNNRMVVSVNSKYEYE